MYVGFDTKILHFVFGKKHKTIQAPIVAHSVQDGHFSRPLAFQQAETEFVWPDNTGLMALPGAPSGTQKCSKQALSSFCNPHPPLFFSEVAEVDPRWQKFGSLKAQPHVLCLKVPILGPEHLRLGVGFIAFPLLIRMLKRSPAKTRQIANKIFW